MNTRYVLLHLLLLPGITEGAVDGGLAKLKIIKKEVQVLDLYLDHLELIYDKSKISRLIIRHSVS